MDEPHAGGWYASGERPILFGGGLLPPERRWLRPAAMGVDLLVLAGAPLLVGTTIVFTALLFAAATPAGLPSVFRTAQGVAAALFLLRDAFPGGSPGKRLLGLKVVCKDGSPPGARESLLRNLPLLLPGWNLLELLALSATRGGRRPGDAFAGTVVLEG